MSEALDIVFTAPHPDDLEIGMGGTIAKMVDLGHRVGMIHLTSGEPTPRGTLEVRRKEAEKAADVLGVAVMENLDLPNRVLMDCPENRYSLATALRRHRPKIVVCMAGRTVAASPDHYQSQLLTEASRFYSQLTKWDDRFDDTAPFIIQHLVYRPVPFSAEIHHWPSRFVVDISNTMQRKIDAISCYESQFDPARREGLLHYISSVCGAEGAMIGVKYGEMYALPHPLPVHDMVAALGEKNRRGPYHPDKPPRGNSTDPM